MEIPSLPSLEADATVACIQSSTRRMPALIHAVVSAPESLDHDVPYYLYHDVAESIFFAAQWEN